MSRVLTDRIVSARGGGSAEVPWRRLVCTPAALVDPGGLLDAASSFDGQGRETLVFAAHAAVVDGYQEAVARRTALLLDVIPDLDLDTDQLELLMHAPSWTHGTVEAGAWFGVLDSETVDASLQGAAACWRQQSAGADLAGKFGATSVTLLTNNLALEAVLTAIRFGSNGTVRESQMAMMGLVQATSRWEHLMASTTDNLRDQLASWVLAWGGWHGSTDSPAGLVQQVDLAYRVIRQPRGISYWSLPAKPSAAITIVFIGDSTTEGVGDDPTGDGSDELAYGGAALPAGVSLNDGGSVKVVWPDNGGLGGSEGVNGDPGVLPHLARHALEAGYSTIRLFRHGANSAATSTVHSQYLPPLVNNLVAAGLSPDEVDLVVLQCGSNDVGAGGEATILAFGPAMADAARQAFRRARLAWVGPGCLEDPTTRPEADEVRAAIESLMSERGSYIDTTAVADWADVDHVHPGLVGYAEIGAAVWAAYQVAA